MVSFLGNSVTGGNDHLSGNDDADGYSFMMSKVLSVGRKENGNHRLDCKKGQEMVCYKCFDLDEQERNGELLWRE